MTAVTPWSPLASRRRTPDGSPPQRSDFVSDRSRALGEGRGRLIVITHPGERGDGDQTAIPWTEIGPPPEVVEDHVVGELHELWRDGPEFIGQRLARCASEAGFGNAGRWHAVSWCPPSARYRPDRRPLERGNGARPSAVDGQVRQNTGSLARLYAVVRARGPGGLPAAPACPSRSGSRW